MAHIPQPISATAPLSVTAPGCADSPQQAWRRHLAGLAQVARSLAERVDGQVTALRLATLQQAQGATPVRSRCLLALRAACAEAWVLQRLVTQLSQ